MIYYFPQPEPQVLASFTLGNKGLGFCKELRLSLQTSPTRRRAGKVVRLIRAVNLSGQRHDAPPDR